MLVALAQMNSVIGDFEGNRARILAFAAEAAGAPARTASGAAGKAAAGPSARLAARPDLLVFPELALCGY
ncbi:MAG TPA: hypothetical protein PLG14_10905, partial [Spirochaetales bacterium]|nr:hypothetical protein [Spirochaetales bacterium]